MKAFMDGYVAPATKLAVVAALLLACDDGPAGPEGVVAGVRVTAPTTALVAGASVQVQAVPLDRTGRVLGGRSIVWSSTNDSVISITPAGVATARAPGEASVLATMGGRTGGIRFRVTNPPVGSVRIIPPWPLQADPGAVLQLAVEVRAVDGTPIVGLPAAWEVSDTTVATVSDGGRLQAVAYGSAVVTARVGGAVATTTISVSSLVDRIDVSHGSVTLDIGETSQVVAVARGSDGMMLNRPFTWSSSNPATATVASGRITAHAAGSAVVTVSSEGRSAAVLVTVVPWRRQRLLAVDGSGLPASVTIADSTAEGPRLSTYHVTDGMLRRSGDRYQLVLFGSTAAGLRHIESSGVIMFDVFRNVFALYPDGRDPRTDAPQFVAPAVLPPGTLPLTGSLTGTGPEVTLLFSRP